MFFSLNILRLCLCFNTNNTIVINTYTAYGQAIIGMIAPNSYPFHYLLEYQFSYAFWFTSFFFFPERYLGHKTRVTCKWFLWREYTYCDILMSSYSFCVTVWCCLFIRPCLKVCIDMQGKCSLTHVTTLIIKSYYMLQDKMCMKIS